MPKTLRESFTYSSNITNWNTTKPDWAHVCIIFVTIIWNITSILFWLSIQLASLIYKVDWLHIYYIIPYQDGSLIWSFMSVTPFPLLQTISVIMCYCRTGNFCRHLKIVYFTNEKQNYGKYMFAKYVLVGVNCYSFWFNF